ncbi:hypothetical protein VSU19_10340 [Verrucomicrobiales bacterium BCK34]|nr:hypothetical protein [Verrucomicrobiales bacterium BCK34]
MISQVVSEAGHILLLVSILAWLGQLLLRSYRGAVIGFAVGAVLSVLPMEYSPQFYTRSVLGDLSALSWVFLIHLLSRSVYGVNLVSPGQGGVVALVAVVGGLLVYPASLGAPWLDFYRLGFDSVFLIYSFAGAALVFILRGRFVVALWLVMALMGYGFCLLESLNFWDCLFDYPSFVVASGILLRRVIARSRPDRKSELELKTES